MKVNVMDYRNVYFCGDIHGNFKTFIASLELLGYDSDKDLIITMGDVIDRGKESFKTAMYFLEPKKTLSGLPSAVSTLGNHEDFGIDVHVHKNKDWIDSWHYHGGDWTLDYDDNELETLFTRLNDEFPLFLDIEYKGKHIVASHSAIPGYDYSKIESVKDKELVRKWLLHKTESFPIDEEDDSSNFPLSFADLSIHGHTTTLNPILYKNRLYLDTGCGRVNEDKNTEAPLTFLKLSESEGVSLMSFEKNKNIVKLVDDQSMHLLQNEIKLSLEEIFNN